jgi:hypothetical protein
MRLPKIFSPSEWDLYDIGAAVAIGVVALALLVAGAIGSLVTWLVMRG